MITKMELYSHIFVQQKKANIMKANIKKRPETEQEIIESIPSLDLSMIFKELNASEKLYEKYIEKGMISFDRLIPPKDGFSEDLIRKYKNKITDWFSIVLESNISESFFKEELMDILKQKDKKNDILRYFICGKSRDKKFSKKFIKKHFNEHQKEVQMKEFHQ